MCEAAQKRHQTCQTGMGRALTLDQVLLGVFGAARPVGALAQHCTAGRASRAQCSPVSKLSCTLLLSMRPRRACGTHHTMPAHHSTDLDTLHPAAPPLTWILHLCFLILIQPHLLAQSLALPAITTQAGQSGTHSNYGKHGIVHS